MPKGRGTQGTRLGSFTVISRAVAGLLFSVACSRDGVEEKALCRTAGHESVAELRSTLVVWGASVVGLGSVLMAFWRGVAAFGGDVVRQAKTMVGRLLGLAYL